MLTIIVIYNSTLIAADTAVRLYIRKRALSKLAFLHFFSFLRGLGAPFTPGCDGPAFQ